MCTLNKENVPITVARADDNGAYQKRGNASRCYYVKDGFCQLTHKDKDGNHYINLKDSSAATAKPVYKKKFVETEFVYCLTRQYQYSKSNNFYNMIATVNCVEESVPPHKFYMYFYMYLNRWTCEEAFEPREFVVERHANATKPHAGPYYRRDKTVFKEIQEKLSNGIAPDEVYIQISKNNSNALSVSQMLHNPKVVHNQKQKMLAESKPKNVIVEAESLIELLHNGSFDRSVHFDGDAQGRI